MTKVIYLVLINLVTPKAQAKHEPFVQQTGLSPRHGENDGKIVNVSLEICGYNYEVNMYIFE